MTEKENNFGKYFWVVVAGILALNFLAYQILKTKLSIPTDAETAYIPAAVNLLEGRGYAVDGRFYTHHPPLFPLLIAGIFTISQPWSETNGIYPFLVLQLQSFSCGFLYLIAARFFGKRAGVIAAVLMASYPSFLVLTATRYAWNATPLLMFLLYAAMTVYFYAAEKGKRILFFAGGVLLGLACLTWAGMIHFWLILCLFLPSINRHKTKFAVVLLALGFLLPVAIWSGMVYRHTGQATVSTASATALTGGLARFSGSKLHRFEISKRAHELWMKGRLNTGKQALEIYAQELRDNPSETVKFLGYKALRCWYGTDSEQRETPVAATQIFYLLPAVYGIILGFRKNKTAAFLLIISIAYFWGVAFMTISIFRYLMPAMGFVMILAAAGLEGFFLTFGRKSRPSL